MTTPFGLKRMGRDAGIIAAAGAKYNWIRSDVPCGLGPGSVVFGG
ncbi:MAG TPA: hypothetical protein VN517_01860 [Terriglobales bacterium]|nr:hypothetical protein [Terriglobales bacterium]